MSAQQSASPHAPAREIGSSVTRIEQCPGVLERIPGPDVEEIPAADTADRPRHSRCGACRGVSARHGSGAAAALVRSSEISACSAKTSAADGSGPFPTAATRRRRRRAPRRPRIRQAAARLAGEHGMDVEAPSDRHRIGVLLLVAEDGAAGHHPQARNLRQVVDEDLGQPIAEMLKLGSSLWLASGSTARNRSSATGAGRPHRRRQCDDRVARRSGANPDLTTSGDQGCDARDRGGIAARESGALERGRDPGGAARSSGSDRRDPFAAPSSRFAPVPAAPLAEARPAREAARRR